MELTKLNKVVDKKMSIKDQDRVIKTKVDGDRDQKVVVIAPDGKRVDSPGVEGDYSGKPVKMKGEEIEKPYGKRPDAKKSEGDYSGGTPLKKAEAFKSEFHEDAGKEEKHPMAAEYEEHQEKSKLSKALAGGSVDEGVWKKAKDASQEAFGKIKWPFVQWWYQHHGGK